MALRKYLNTSQPCYFSEKNGAKILEKHPVIDFNIFQIGEILFEKMYLLFISSDLKIKVDILGINYDEYLNTIEAMKHFIN